MLTVSQLLIKEVELSNTPNYRDFDVDSAMRDEPPGPPSKSSCSFPRTCSHHSSCPSLSVSVHFLLLVSQIPCILFKRYVSTSSSKKPFPHPCSTSFLCTRMPGADFSHNTPSAILPSVVHVPLLGGELSVYRDCLILGFALPNPKLDLKWSLINGLVDGWMNE